MNCSKFCFRLAAIMSLGLPLGGSAQAPSLVFEVPADARTAGLGGRLTADFTGDLHAAAFNPAFLDCEDLGRLALDYVNYFGTTTIGSATAVIDANGRRTTAVGTRFSTFGQLDEYDASGQATGGRFSAGDVIVQLSSAWSFEAGKGHWVTAGVAGWAGTRTLDRDVAGLLGLDIAGRGVLSDQLFSWGVAITGLGQAWALGGSQPTGRMPLNLQLGLAKSFANAPFALHLEASQLQQWDLAPEGTYDDIVDPLTGALSPPMAFPFGDALMRHITMGTALRLGESLEVLVGYDYRRRQELRAGDRPGTNGLALGVNFNVQQFQVRLARNTYHFAGASTHLSVSLDLAS